MFQAITFAALTDNASVAVRALMPYFILASGVLVGLRIVRIVQSIRRAASQRGQSYDAKKGGN